MSISNFYNHVNFKLLQSCKFQDSCSHVSQFQFVFAIQSVSVIGQVTSSHPRTACACQFTLVIGQVTSSHPRTTCACQFTLAIGQVASSHTRTACTCRFASILVIGQAAGSNTRTACTYALFLSSAKRLVRIQKQLVPVYFRCPRSSSQFEPKEQLAPVNLLFSLPGESCYLLSC